MADFWPQGLIMVSDKHLAVLANKVICGARYAAQLFLRAFDFPIVRNIFLQPPREQQSARPVRRAGIALVCACVCAALFGRMVHIGFAHGMDGEMYEVVEDAAHAMAVAISDMRYDLHRGYVGYAAVYDVLQSGGFTSNPVLIKAIGRTYPDNLKDRALLNSTLQSALNTSVPPDVGFGDRSLLSMGYADLGLVDYFKLAFRLFGYRIESGFYLYFVLLGLSVAAFILAHWRSPAVLAIPILFLTAGNLVMVASLFDFVNSQTVTNPRFLSTLGILPALHLLMLMLGGQRATAAQIALACVQALIFEFALSVRASLYWGVIFLAFIALIQVAAAIARSTGMGRSIRAALAERRRDVIAFRVWPALVLLLGVWTYQFAISAKMHPSYELDDFLPSHLRYHNAFMGLNYNPYWSVRFGPKYYNVQSDTLGFLAGAMYLIDHYDVPDTYYVSPLYGGPKMQLDDRMVKKAYLQFALDNPWYFIETHYYKIILIWRIMDRMIPGALEQRTTLLVTLGGIVVGTLLFIAGGLPSLADGARSDNGLRLVVVGGLVGMFSWIPYVYAVFYDPVLGDALWTTTLALLIACSGALFLVGTMCFAAIRGRMDLRGNREAERDQAKAAAPYSRTSLRWLAALTVSCVVLWTTTSTLLIACCGMLLLVSIISLAPLRAPKALRGNYEDEQEKPEAAVTDSRTYLRLLVALTLSCATAWSTVTYFTHGRPKLNVSPHQPPAFFNLKAPQ